MIYIYTDGACSGNPGPGGYSYIALQDMPYDIPNDDGNVTIVIKPTIVDYVSNLCSFTTNNEMELAAMLSAFEFIETHKEDAESFVVFSDSAYVVNIVTKWIFTWEQNGWTRSRGLPIENLSLIKELYNYLNTDFFKSKVHVEKVKGHSGTAGNELADALATNNERKFKKIIEEKNIHMNLIL